MLFFFFYVNKYILGFTAGQFQDFSLERIPTQMHPRRKDQIIKYCVNYVVALSSPSASCYAVSIFKYFQIRSITTAKYFFLEENVCVITVLGSSRSKLLCHCITAFSRGHERLKQ